MDKFYLFAGEHYYPRGGVEDLIGVFSSAEECRVRARAGHDWYHIATFDAEGNFTIIEKRGDNRANS